MSTKILDSLEVDDPVVLSAGYLWDTAERRRVDDQIRGIQRHLVDSWIRGTLAAWFTNDQAADLVAGDVVCLSGSATADGQRVVTLATGAALANAGAAIGVVLVAAAKGQPVRIAVGGVLPPSVTGLGSGANRAIRVNTTTGRCEAVAAFAANDYPLGYVDAAGNLTLRPSYVLSTDPAASIVPSLVYRPNGTTSGNVYATEAELLAALPSAGVATVLLDGSANGGTVPIAQTWPLDSRIRLVGLGVSNDGSPATTLQVTGELQDPVFVENVTIGSNASGTAGIVFAANAACELRDVVLSSSHASKPAMLVEDWTVRLVLSGTSLVFRDAYEAVEKGSTGTLVIYASEQSNILSNSLRGTTSEPHPFVVQYEATVGVSGTQANATATFTRAAWAVSVNYDNGSSGLAATDAQTAIDEVASAKANVATTLTGAGGVLVGGDTSAHDLSADRTISLAYGSSASTVCEGNDSRLSNARTPTGSAGGDLAGTYPSPSVAKINGATAPTSPAAGDVGRGIVATAANAYGLSPHREQNAQQTTTDATTTTIVSYVPAANERTQIVGNVTALKAADGTAAIFRKRASFKAISGTVTQIGTTAEIGSDVDTAAAAWAVAIDTSGGAIRVRVTGAAATTIRWEAFAVVTPSVY